MEKTLKERVITFLWGMGGFVGVAIAVYVMNISDVREIELWKLATIVITVAAGYVVNQGTKYLNTK
jgi:NhaP-type Na+/H+ or K+/H+ antiporter